MVLAHHKFFIQFHTRFHSALSIHEERMAQPRTAKGDVADCPSVRQTQYNPPSCRLAYQYRYAERPARQTIRQTGDRSGEEIRPYSFSVLHRQPPVR